MSGLTKAGWWKDHASRTAFVIPRGDGGVRVVYDDAWTCCDAATFDRWKSWGWHPITPAGIDAMDLP